MPLSMTTIIKLKTPLKTYQDGVGNFFQGFSKNFNVFDGFVILLSAIYLLGRKENDEKLEEILKTICFTLFLLAKERI